MSSAAVWPVLNANLPWSISLSVTDGFDASELRFCSNKIVGMWIIGSGWVNRCDSGQQGSTGPTGLKGEVCSAAYIHLCVSAAYCFVYCTHWGGISARKGQQGNQGREVKRVKWEVLDNLVYRAHQDLEGWGETQVFLVHLDLRGDPYESHSLYERLRCQTRFRFQAETCKLMQSSSSFRLLKCQTTAYVTSAESFFTVSLNLSQIRRPVCVLLHTRETFSLSNHPSGAAFTVAWHSADGL